MNILGEGFPDEIIKQVEQRQKVYGSGYTSSPRTPEEIIYLNANTSWVKLASSVNIDDPKIIQDKSLAALGDNITNNKLAKKFVLFNGVDNIDEKLRSGIALNKDLLGNNNAYGIGGTEFGLRPMMGIISADIKHENRGSIRRAIIKVKAFNKVQFDIIDVLYLRLGFNVLLEWGHSMYFDNKGELQKGTDNDNSLVGDFLDGKNLHPNSTNFGVGGSPLTYADFLKLIDYQRKVSNGNYDAMFGKVCNFHWSFLPDGSYDITIELVSIGDIIESFKINALISGIDTSVKVDKIKKDPSQMTSSELIDDYANKSEIGKYFYGLTNIKKIFGKDVNKEAEADSLSFRQNFILQDARANLNAAKVVGNKERIIALEKKISEILTTNTNNEASSTNPDTITINYQGDKADNIYYIRLGAFLDFVEKKLMYHFDVNGQTSPGLKFDTEVKTNLMYIEPTQVSTDPTVCVVRRNILISGDTYKFAESGEEFESPLFSNLSGEINPYGQIMNIYVSMKFILMKLDELKNADTNKVVLIDFLNNILSAINSSLGGISKLETTINETTVIIRDGNPLPNIKNVIEVMKANTIKYDIYDKYAQFDLYGYSTTNPPNSTTNYEGKGHASFIKDFSFTTEISPELSTMITVGATANSTVVGENSTAFSKFNAGLTDRYKEKIVYLKEDGTPDTETYQTYNPSQPISTPEARNKAREEEEQTLLYKGLYLKYASTYSAYCDYIKKLSGTSPTYNGEADTYKDALNNFINYKQQADSVLWASLVKKDPINYAIPKKFAPSTGFIPFNMSLTMEGLSGMKIYSKFNIDIEYLPANYPDNADFLIKNINHTISNNKWFTKIESVVISQGGDINSNTGPDILPTGQNPNASSTDPVESTLGTLPSFIENNNLLNLGSFIYPVTGNIVSKIVVRAVQNGVVGSDQHRGIDISAVKGTPVYSSTVGKVVRIGAGGYGPNAVWIQIDKSAYVNPSDALSSPKYIVYGHLDTNLVNIGDTVSKGQQIGTVGDKDAPNRFHLHYQIRNVSFGYDKDTLSTDLNVWFPPKGGSIAAKQPFINVSYQPSTV